jgi:pimeloyl-ACP methyl ester carboxylesterase
MNRSRITKWAAVAALATPLPRALFADDKPDRKEIEARVEHGFADSDGVKIHYASLGKGPLVIMIHGFPDFWYSWRDQMDALSGEYRCVAIDQRGYNLSDKPKGKENYDMSLLVADVAAVIEHLGEEKAIIVGHDWGGMVAWTFAMTKPKMTERLVILNLPHPKGLSRELATNPEQQKASQYARDFQKEGAHLKIKPEHLAFWVKDENVRPKYVEAFQKSDIEAMLHYYKQNYPREPYTQGAAEDLPKVTTPVLMIHGLDDTALLSPALNGTWDWVEKDLTLVTIPGAGHFVQQDASSLVSRSIRAWLNRDE